MNVPKPQETQTALRPAAPEVRAELDRILQSASFRGSRRSSDFLRFVVEQTLEGAGDDLKERTLGVAVFGRSPDYDTNQDPIVRNTAGQVRRRLAQYYMEPDTEAEIRIDLPAGSYVPEIYKPAAAEPNPVSAPPDPPRRSAPKRLLVGGIVAAAAAAWFWQRPPAPGDLDKYWAPILRQPGAVVLCVGQGHTYKLGPEWDRRFEESAATGAPVAGGTVPLADITPVWDRQVGISDAHALLRLTALFTRFDKPVELRGGRSTSLDDLRRRPVVLIGALNNDWTMSLTGELRFYFESDPAARLDLVRDRQRPDHRDWAVRSDVPVSRVQTDYAIVTRVFNPTTEKAVVVAAGIKGGGTAAASEFLTNPGYLTQALRGVPTGWQEKNVQIVLSVRMFSGSPGPPTVLATHVWERH